MPSNETDNNLDKSGSRFESPAIHFGSALVRESLQRPINGALELVSEVSHKHLPELHLVADKRIPNDSWDSMGGYAGRAIDYLIVNRLTHGKLLSEESSSAQVFRNNMVYGALDGGVFTPTHETGKNFWEKRSGNALENGLIYGTGALVGIKGFEKLGKKSPIFDGFLSKNTRYGTALYLSNNLANHVAEKQTERDNLEPDRQLAKTVSSPASNEITLPRQSKNETTESDPSNKSIVTQPDKTTTNLFESQRNGASEPGAGIDMPLTSERLDADGKFDQSALAKRVAHMLEENSLNPDKSVWVSQHGKDIVLKGKISGRDALIKLVEAVQHYDLVEKVSEDQIKVAKKASV